MIKKGDMRIAIVGGGASGFMAAITAAETFPGATITIFEKNKTVLNKVRISGGGRCNVTHNPFGFEVFYQKLPSGRKIIAETFTSV
jgi:predicted flavoprotein YhiN